jgi:CopA family copper-resistance protein
MSNPKRFPATPDTPSSVSRRTFLGTAGALGALAGLERITPAYARPLHQTSSRWLESGAGADASDADAMNLVIREASIDIAGKRATATAINDTVPGPLLRFREGRDYTVRVANHLNGDTSIHWHGVLVPNAMDGVPGVTFAGIRPGETFAYQLPLRQSGTYWYHSHSGLQEQTGLYGPIIIDPAEPEPFAYDREYVVMLSDWTFEDPYKLLDHLKKQSEYYNYQRRTVPDFFRDVKRRGFRATLNDRMAWGKMRMTPTDISDITGATYTYLMNGLAPESNWTGLFAPGERVRLRFINAGAGTYFDVRVPGLEMTVVAVSGQYVKPVVTDEFRLEIAQTVDVIVQPSESHAYTIFAESMDRSGYARGTLSPRLGMAAAVPMRRPRPTLLMGDMGMAMQDMAGMDMGGGMPDMPDMPGMPAAAPTAAPSPLASNGLRAPGTLPPAVEHGPETHGSGNAATPQITRSRLGEPGNGLGADGWRVLRYTDLRALLPHADALRPPEREVEFHLTGNMERYMWSIDGVKFSDVKEPVHFTQGERIRITMVNDTMMSHPMHLHGMWMDLENGSGADMPRVHTINVKPAERLSVLVSPADVGGWAFHCHILYHMEMGMFRVVQVAPANRLTTGGGPGDEGVR